MEWDSLKEQWDPVKEEWGSVKEEKDSVKEEWDSVKDSVKEGCDLVKDEWNSVKDEWNSVKDEWNSVNGESNSVNGESNSVNGEWNSVNGEWNSVKDEWNSVKDEWNSVKDESNSVNGESNSVNGEWNSVKDESNSVNGESNSVKGEWNSVKDEWNTGNTVKDELNSVKDEWNSVKGEWNSVKGEWDPTEEWAPTGQWDPTQQWDTEDAGIKSEEGWEEWSSASCPNDADQSFVKEEMSDWWDENEWDAWAGHSAAESTAALTETKQENKKKRLPAQPAPLDEQVGMDMMEYHPKDAVRRFFNRYTAKPATSTDCFYRVQKVDGGKICELHTPSFYSRVFKGIACKTIKDAETSAAEKFCQDPDVQAAAAKLPPNMKACRRSAGGGASKRQWQAREDHGDVATKRQRAENLFDDFRERGCRTWFDDGNA